MANRLNTVTTDMIASKRLRAHVPQPLGHARPDVAVALRRKLIDVKPPEGEDDRQKADAVDEKAASQSQPLHQVPGERGADDARDIEGGGVERDGVHQVVFAHHVRHHRLPGRKVVGGDDAAQQRDERDVPDPHRVSPDERRHYERQQHVARLGEDDQVFAVHPVGGDSAEQREEEKRNRAEKGDVAQGEGAAGDLVDQPGAGDVLNPASDLRDEVSGPVNAVRAVVEGSKHEGGRLLRSDSARGFDLFLNIIGNEARRYRLSGEGRNDLLQCDGFGSATPTAHETFLRT
jgi:hypothetical protein